MTSSAVPSGADSQSPPRRFSLDGPTTPVDATFNAYREDVADIALAGKVIASHYAEPLIRICVTATELLHGRAVSFMQPEALIEAETFAVLDCTLGLAWGYRVRDHRVGYVDQTALAPTD